MATKKQAETQKAKEQADESLKKLSEALKHMVDVRQLQRQYNELKQDYLELAMSVQQAASNSARIMHRHNIKREDTFSFGGEPKNNG
jgi:tryptophan synthase beta subunit